MGIVKWLHISDLHLNKSGVETTRLREKLPLYLQSLGVKCDYVFFSGDLRYAPMGAYSKDTVETLVKICNAVGVPISRLFITPGNHDVERNIPKRNTAIHNEWFWPQDKQKSNYVPSEGIIKKEDFESIMLGTDNYRQVVKEIITAQSEENTVSVFGPHTLIKTNTLNVIEVDSTISYTCGQESNLIIGTEWMRAALSKCDPEKIILILTHYSFDFLNRSEQNIVFELMHDYNAHIWIAGHEHSNLLRMQRDWFYEFQSGNLLLEKDAQTSFLMGEINTDLLTGQVSAHAWYSPHGWASYPFTNPGADNPSVYCFNLSNDRFKQCQLRDAQRKGLRDKIFPILMENQSIFTAYGPTEVNRTAIRSESVALWDQFVVERIIPNSLQVIELLKANMKLLSDKEIATLEKYKLHIIGLKKNHLSHDGFSLNAPIFPSEIFSILQ